MKLFILAGVWNLYNQFRIDFFCVFIVVVSVDQAVFPFLLKDGEKAREAEKASGSGTVKDDRSKVEIDIKRNEIEISNLNTFVFMNDYNDCENT